MQKSVSYSSVLLPSLLKKTPYPDSKKFSVMPDLIRHPEKLAFLIHLDSSLRRNDNTTNSIIINSKYLREVKTVKSI